ncbi:MAG: hypothetical protein CVV58_04580, partial [Tenericutes bacterium HGW-Tenericutes-3]
YLKTFQQAFSLKKRLTLMGIDVLGPTPAMIKKIKEHYRFTLTLKSAQAINQSVFDEIKTFETKDIEVRYYPTLDHV